MVETLGKSVVGSPPDIATTSYSARGRAFVFSPEHASEIFQMFSNLSPYDWRKHELFNSHVSPSNRWYRTALKVAKNFNNVHPHMKIGAASILGLIQAERERIRETSATPAASPASVIPGSSATSPDVAEPGSTPSADAKRFAKIPLYAIFSVGDKIAYRGDVAAIISIDKDHLTLRFAAHPDKSYRTPRSKILGYGEPLKDSREAVKAFFYPSGKAKASSEPQSAPEEPSSPEENQKTEAPVIRSKVRITKGEIKAEDGTLFGAGSEIEIYSDGTFRSGEKKIISATFSEDFNSNVVALDKNGQELHVGDRVKLYDATKGVISDINLSPDGAIMLTYENHDISGHTPHYGPITFESERIEKLPPAIQPVDTNGAALAVGQTVKIKDENTFAVIKSINEDNGQISITKYDTPPGNAAATVDGNQLEVVEPPQIGNAPTGIIKIDLPQEITEKYGSRIPAGKYYDDWSNMLPQLETDFYLNDNVMLTGAAGTGKSQLAEYYAQLKGLPTWRVNGHRETTSAELFGSYVPSGSDEKGNAVFVWQDGAIPASMRAGGILILDEINSIPGDVLAGLNSSLDVDYKTVDLASGERVTGKPTWRVIATQNPSIGLGQEVGTEELPSRISGRFVGHLVTYPPPDVETDLIVKYLKNNLNPATGKPFAPYGLTPDNMADLAWGVALVGKMREAVEKGERQDVITKAPQIRQTIEYGKRIVSGINREEAFDTGVLGIYAEKGVDGLSNIRAAVKELGQSLGG